MPQDNADHPVLIVAPLGQDAAAMAAVLAGEGIESRTFTKLTDCCETINTETGTVLLTEEALELPQLPKLVAALQNQPSWSQLPLIVLAHGGEHRRATLMELTAAASGSMTVLERPMSTFTLLQAVRVALSSRRRQHQVRDLLEQQQQHVRERAERAKELKRSLDQRTKEVTRSLQQLATAERMAAVGTLASGLAHDIINITLPLTTRLQMVISDAAGKLEPESIESLNSIAGLVDHLKQMARNLSLFARDPEQEGSVGTTDLADWSARVHNLFATTVFSKSEAASIDFETDIPPDLPPVSIAPHRLTQAMLNLVHNARDAILAKGGDGAGRIAIEARSLTEASAVILKVIDDGIGMSEEVVRRSIEPFYTTKDRPDTHGAEPSATTGSGMGLSLVHGIIRKCGGSLDIESESGRGTIISLTLPAAAPRPAPDPPLPETHVRPAHKGGVRTA